MPVSSQVKSKVMSDPSDVWGRVKEVLGAGNAPEVARKLSITKQSVYEWQKKLPGLENLFLIARSGNASLHWLLTGEGPKSSDRDDLIDYFFDEPIKQYVFRRAASTGWDFKRLLDQIALESGAYNKIKGAEDEQPVDKEHPVTAAQRDLGKQNDQFSTLLRDMVREEVEIALHPDDEFIQRVGRVNRATLMHPALEDRIDALEFPQTENGNSDAETDDTKVIAEIDALLASLPENVGLLFHNLDKLSLEEKAEALRQIKAIIEENTTSKSTARRHRQVPKK